MKWKYVTIRHLRGTERIIGYFDTEEDAWKRGANDSRSPCRDPATEYSVRRKRAY